MILDSHSLVERARGHVIVKRDNEAHFQTFIGRSIKGIQGTSIDGIDDLMQFGNNLEATLFLTGEARLS